MSDVHWGRWIIARAKHVGFPAPGYAALARAIGCGALTVRRWSRCSAPPAVSGANLRALASALQTDEQTVLRGYASTPPDAAAIVAGEPGEAAGHEAPADGKAVAEIAAMIRALEPGELISLCGLLAGELAVARAPRLDVDDVEVAWRVEVLTQRVAAEQFGRRRCPFCFKLKGRPAALRDHLKRMHYDEVCSLPPEEFA